MGIGRIAGYNPSFDYASTIKKVDVDTVKKQDELRAQEEDSLALGAGKQQGGVATQAANAAAEEALSVAAQAQKAPRMADLENISLGFNAGDTYDYIGKDSDITLLDKDQALSDIQKDSVLDQYRYFVGDSATASANMGLAGDGIVVQK